MKKKLLSHMQTLVIPLTFIRWLRAFPSDRRARVKLYNVLSNISILLRMKGGKFIPPGEKRPSGRMPPFRAYDTVWRERLLSHMQTLVIPLTFLRWLRAFPIDRRARVEL